MTIYGRNYRFIGAIFLPHNTQISFHSTHVHQLNFLSQIDSEGGVMRQIRADIQEKISTIVHEANPLCSIFRVSAGAGSNHR